MNTAAQMGSMSALAELVAGLRASGERVVHARGTFDLLVREDIARLRAARERAHALVITVAAGGGSHAPLLGVSIRAEVVAALPFVRAVAVEEGADARDVVALLGADEVIDFDEEPSIPPPPPTRPSVKEATGRREIVYEKKSAGTEEAQDFLREFRLRYTAADVIEALGKLKKLKVLVIGDAIIDEYHFVRPYGMPLKAPIIAAQFVEGEAYAGGILAVANHLAGFCDDVHLVTALGAKDSREDFIRAHLYHNVRPKFFYKPDSPTTVKRRYLIRFLVQKLFEVGFFDDRPLPPELDEQVTRYVEAACGDYDLVVVADFGHGLLSDKTVDALTRKAPFLAVNTQLNSVNFGYHVITKYSRVDYVCIDEPEMRIAARDRVTPAEKLLKPLSDSLKAQVVTVTRGHHGSITYRRDGTRVAIPILSRQVIDTIGAGDAYLAITAPCVKMGFPPELVGFIGNAVGGIAVRIVGNKEAVGPEPLFTFIKALMEP